MPPPPTSSTGLIRRPSWRSKRVAADAPKRSSSASWGSSSAWGSASQAHRRNSSVLPPNSASGSAPPCGQVNEAHIMFVGGGSPTCQCVT